MSPSLVKQLIPMRQELDSNLFLTVFNMAGSVPAVAHEAVLVQSGQLPVEPVKVIGYDFNKGVDYHAILQSYRTSGFQATNFGRAVEEINKMVG